MKPVTQVIPENIPKIIVINAVKKQIMNTLEPVMGASRNIVMNVLEWRLKYLIGAVGLSR